MIISRNLDYFEMLLDKSRNQNGVINADASDVEKIKNAFEKAHDIRKFETGMYWQRSAYLWGFISVLAAACAYCFVASLDKDITNSSKMMYVAAIILISILGYILCNLWQKIMYASKYWQENWEFHIDMLEPYVSGNLHKIHFMKMSYRIPQRYSIHDIILSIIHRFYAIWYITSIASLLIFFNQAHQFIDFDDKFYDFKFFGISLVIGSYAIFELILLSLHRRKHKRRTLIDNIPSSELKVTLDKINCSKL